MCHSTSCDGFDTVVRSIKLAWLRRVFVNNQEKQAGFRLEGLSGIITNLHDTLEIPILDVGRTLSEASKNSAA